MRFQPWEQGAVVPGRLELGMQAAVDLLRAEAERQDLLKLDYSIASIERANHKIAAASYRTAADYIEKKLKEIRRDFQEHVRNTIHADYDRGFFSAWSDYTKVLLKLYHGKEQKKKIPEVQSPQAEPKVLIAPKKTVQARLK